MEKLDNTTGLETYISARCAEATKSALEQMAAADKRNLSNYVRLVLEKHVEEAAAADKSKKKVA